LLQQQFQAAARLLLHAQRAASCISKVPVCSTFLKFCGNRAVQVWRGTLWGKPVAVKLLPLLDVDERQLECLRREVAVLLHTTGECKQVSACPLC
jgi:hypothetical protein